jgi:hypothetical protein
MIVLRCQSLVVSCLLRRLSTLGTYTPPLFLTSSEPRGGSTTNRPTQSARACTPKGGRFSESPRRTGNTDKRFLAIVALKHEESEVNTATKPP